MGETPTLVAVAMEALKDTRESLCLPALDPDELEQQATVMIHALYAKGWILKRLLNDDGREAV
jgi:hypothetical protein